MARVLSQSFIRLSSSSFSAAAASSSCVVPRRNRSHQSGKAQLIEVDMESEGGDVEVLSIRKLEDVIHRIIAQRSAPSWLPFIPGSSYWVPPKRPNLVEVIGKVANTLNPEESLSFTTPRGWPCSAFFIEDFAPPVPMMEVEVKVQSDSESISQSKDQEG
ncbi:uncharacterized protein LOC131165482 [Malania oleifera]|uniref:uncharacterized protein LOC131165482 n=1 Tax=Malania oleifera TaxID=397392 RepID=UPI0025ADEE8C|nr:uncharacterized protein LOC131165482 [Malania oleifera]XP_057979323.1 uncharacterized protein LOC131165482 [Malania oleifera]